MSETLLLTILIVFSGLYLAWSIGANDVANAMGTSVGSGALTLRQAIVIAAVLEFSGAFFFGSHVTETVQKGIIKPEVFSLTPLDFVLGMLSALIASGMWVQIATFFGWPVSTTHSIIGGVIGFGAVLGGIGAVVWENVFLIGISWILSPLAGGLIAFAIFSFLRSQILYRSHPFIAAKKWLPWIIFALVFLLSLFFFFGGIKTFAIEVDPLYGLLVSLLVSFISALIGKFFIDRIVVPEKKKEEPFAPEILVIEKIFGGLQIVSASLMAFSHGANDVANAIGPLSAALFVLETKSLALSSIEIPLWMLALGGGGIVLGLATWGWRVIATIGKKLTELTPTRGFSAEFAAAFTILVASRLGMPISTTHTLVGAVIGVGLARGIGTLNLTTIRDILLSWIITIPVGACLSCSIFFLLRLFFV